MDPQIIWHSLWRRCITAFKPVGGVNSATVGKTVVSGAARGPVAVLTVRTQGPAVLGLRTSVARIMGVYTTAGGVARILGVYTTAGGVARIMGVCTAT